MGGSSFKKLPRPAAGSAKCPEGTEACPGEASKTPENMICLPIKEHKNCPITDIMFLKDDASAPTGYSTGKIFVNGYAVSFSKTAKDRLPIHSVRMDIQPCAISTQKSGVTGIPYHKLEKEAEEACVVSKLNQQLHDSRYIQTDFTYNLGKLHEEMDIFRELSRFLP
jgi:hypothetical protein